MAVVVRCPTCATDTLPSFATGDCLFCGTPLERDGATLHPCRYCGNAGNEHGLCPAHADLPELDPFAEDLAIVAAAAYRPEPMPDHPTTEVDA